MDSPLFLNINECTTYSSSDEAVAIAGLPVTSKGLLKTLNLTAVPHDETILKLKFAHSGTRRTQIEVSQPRDNNRKVTIKPIRGDEIALKYGKSGTEVVSGEFQISFITHCGEVSKDVLVTITVKPDHPNETAEISYTVSDPFGRK